MNNKVETREKIKELDKTLANCPCGKEEMCFSSGRIDYQLCLTCGLQTFLGTPEELEASGEVYKDNMLKLGNKTYVPYFLTYPKFVYLDKDTETGDYVWIVMNNVDGLPDYENAIKFEQNDFTSVMTHINSL